MHTPLGEVGPREGRRRVGGPGKSERVGLPRRRAARLFATDEQAREWLESVVWPNGHFCPSCGSTRVTDKPVKGSVNSCLEIHSPGSTPAAVADTPAGADWPGLSIGAASLRELPWIRLPTRFAAPARGRFARPP